MKKSGFVMPLLLLIIAACHRDTNSNNNMNPVTNVTPNGGAGPTIPAGAAGAFYAINNTNYNNNGSGYDTTNSGLGYAWFGSYTTTQNAGSVVANGDSLYITDPLLGVTFPWYEVDMLNPIFYTSDPVAWRIQGNSANGIPAFNYTDNTAFPVVTGLALSYPVSISSPLTVHFAVSGAYDVIFYSISGAGGQAKSFTGTSGATSATFTAAQLATVTASGGQLAVQIMPVKLTPYSISGKTYYFVKQSAFSVGTIVQ